MSDDLISRQAAIDAINEHFEFVTSGLGIDSEVKKIYKIAYNHTIDVIIISILPDIQPEQKTGRWIYMKGCEDWFCSNCKDIFMLLEGTPKDNDYNYCPNCGAYMKGENN